jgi:hypothetical protein
MSINYIELAITVITNVLFISLFIGFFFFTYGAYIEKEIVKSQMEFLASNVSSSIKILGPGITNKFKNIIGNLNLPNLDSADSDVAIKNSLIRLKAVIANVILIVLVILGVYFLYSYSDKSFSIIHILSKNFIILIFVALTEFSFLTFFVSKFISLNPNSVNYNIIYNLKQFLAK